MVLQCNGGAGGRVSGSPCLLPGIAAKVLTITSSVIGALWSMCAFSGYSTSPVRSQVTLPQ